MTTFFIGQIDEVRPRNRKNKETGQIYSFGELTVTYQAKDNEGYLDKKTEKIQIDDTQIGKFVANKNKFVAVPYTYTVGKDKSWFYADLSNHDAKFFDSNPLVIDTSSPFDSDKKKKAS
jgi:hypothetical protein